MSCASDVQTMPVGTWCPTSPGEASPNDGCPSSIDGDEYAIDISYDEDIDQHVDADGVDADVTGTLVGGGTSTGSVSNPLATAASITQDFDVDFDSDDQSMTMVMKVAVQVAPQVS